MLMRGGSGAGGLRGTLVAFAAIALAIAGSWFVPALAWHGLAAMERPPAAAVQADSSAPAAPTVPGAQVPAPDASPAAAPTPASPWHRLSGLVGLVLTRDRGGAVAQPPRHPVAGRRGGSGYRWLFAIFVLRCPSGRTLPVARRFVTGILEPPYVGSEFVFGEIG
jgi:hypothetical protein